MAIKLCCLQLHELLSSTVMETLIFVVYFAIPGLRQRCEIEVEGIGASKGTVTRGETIVTIRSTIAEDFELQFNAYIIPSITSETPVMSIDGECWRHLRRVRLADPTFGEPGKIDMLIGADIWGMIIQEGVITGGSKEPCAIRTRLGWVVFGPATTNATNIDSLHSFHSNKCISEQRLDELLRKFWEIEELPSSVEISTGICEQIYEDTVTRNVDGRYSVQIPFRPDAEVLGNSYQLALRQFHQLERKLSNNPDLRDKYVEFMREYIDLGHMELVTEQQGDQSQVYYIPHHAVTEKFRVVFNASAKSSNGVSLNDTQLAGPQLQDALVNILLRFRRFRIAVTADVEKMFRQVQIQPVHRCWQQIIWREAPTEPLCTYQLKTVTYGMASGPFNAIRSLRQCASDNYHVIVDKTRAEFARKSIMSNFYVDDFLDSADTSKSVRDLASDVDTILQKGKFYLRKWNSNNMETLTAITGSTISASELELSDSDTKVLGLHWNPISDELFYKTKVCKIDAVPTKRTVLSDVARLYDPTGMLSPIIIVGKIFIQSLWQRGLDWDTPLPNDLQDEWLTFRTSLMQLTSIRIPRWLGMTHTANITLHGFGDASKQAYSAVIYVRSVDVNGHTAVALVTARTKVAPVKAISIPNLELCAAHLLVLTLNNVRKSLRLTEVEYTLWSDSSIVLCWLRKSTLTLKQFVSNRVSYIQQHSKIQAWRHVRSKMNPADCASRGITPAALEQHPLWWSGPPFIHEYSDEGFHQPILSSSDFKAFNDGLKPLRVLLTMQSISKLTTRIEGQEEIPLIERFSTLQRLLHTTALVRRFCPTGRRFWRTNYISAEETEGALLWHIQEAQGNVFSNEINALKSRFSVDTRSKLRQMNPFLDNNGIIRYGGRLSNAELNESQRNPIILPKDSTLSKLLVHNSHKITLHGGIQQMMQFLNRRFHIIHGRALVKTHIHRCVTCKRHQRTMQQQQMAALPRSRVLVAPPFSNTGLDYCGPFNVRLAGRRVTTTVKTYGVIFVCMCTKAVHIELAEDLSSRAFLNVFDRFISRRGCCTNLYSDNGTQFVGANRIMQHDLREWNNELSTQYISDAGVNWHFISPASPHHGGLWEAAVRSAKKHLLRVVGKQSMEYHQLNTLLVRIEACLNSRPLIALHDDPDEGVALSPGDFLIGRPLTTRPEPIVPEVPDNRLKYWQRLQRMYQHFWKRWKNEYLMLLQARSKWTRIQPNMQIDDVVVIQDDNLPPSRWRIGRIIAVHPGSDGLVRVVTIEYNSDKRNTNGLFIKHQCQRPVQKLCRLVEAHEEIPNPTGSAGQDV